MPGRGRGFAAARRLLLAALALAMALLPLSGTAHPPAAEHHAATASHTGGHADHAHHPAEPAAADHCTELGCVPAGPADLAGALMLRGPAASVLAAVGGDRPRAGRMAKPPCPPPRSIA